MTTSLKPESRIVGLLPNRHQTPKEIGLAGHSEGGLIAPMVVGLRDDVAFIVLLAATGVDGATINESQTEAMLRAAGTDESEIKKALAEGGNKDFEMIVLEGLNHLFQQCTTGSMNEYVSIQETFNPLALEKISDWIVNHTTQVD